MNANTEKWLFLALGLVLGWLYANRSTVLFAAKNSGKIDAAGQVLSGLQGLGVSI